MKTQVFAGVGAAFAALAALPAAAQEQVQTINQNFRQESISTETSNSTSRIINEGIPRAPQQAPSLGLGNIYGLNPCATGVSVGVSTPLVGLGGAFSTIDDECQTRNNAAVLVSGLRDEAAAREVLCQIKHIREAFVRLGRPCIQDGGAVTVLPSNYPAGAGQAGQFPGQIGSQIGNATQLPADAMPPAVRDQGGGTNGDPRVRSEPINSAPAFCRTPGLTLSLYPECTGQQVATAPGRAAPRPAAAPRPERRDTPPAPAPSFNPATGRLGQRPAQEPPTSEPPTRGPMLGNAAGSPDGCNRVPDSIRRLYAECVAAERQLAIAQARGGIGQSGSRLAASER